MLLKPLLAEQAPAGAQGPAAPRAGKILIRGEYLLVRASGVNRIQGGSVQIN
ncbi:hypothetical protein WME94_57670 [Sorangium sp. So ce429]